jgi:hypothetical protein
MTRTWCTRLLALGGLALAFGCRSHPNVPPCDTPLFPEDVINRPAPVPPAPTVTGAKLPTSEGQPGILPPPQFTKLPDNKQPDVHLPETSPDAPPIVPPKDVAPLLTIPPKAMSSPTPRDVMAPIGAPDLKPVLVEPPRPSVSPDGFAPATALGPPKLPAVGVVVPIRDTRPPLPLRSGERFGHAPDYKWVAGILDRHQKGGYWTVRYTPSGEDDPWGGKVRLLGDDLLTGFNSGDVVYVEGELLAPRRAADTAAYPPYRVIEVRLVEKAK